MRPKRKYLQEKVFSNHVNQLVPKHGMTAAHYADFQQMITGLEKPNMLKKRLRVYFKGERTTLKWYMDKYFRNFYQDVDDDAGRIVFITDSEQSRDNLYNVLKEIKDDNNVDVPVTNPDNPDPNPNPGDGGGGSGYYDPETGEYVEEKKSNMTTYLVIAGIVVLVAIVIIKKVF